MFTHSFIDYVPVFIVDDCCRVVLHNPPNGSTDYINASYIGVDHIEGYL